MRNLIRVLSLSLALTSAAFLGSLFVQTGWSQTVTRSIQFSQDPTGFMGVDIGGKHIHALGGLTPSASCANTVLVGTDTAGQVNPTATSCTLTFANPFPLAPTCVVTSTTVAGLPAYSTSTTALTLSTTVSGVLYHWICLGR
jgi:hypothetical protein